MFSGVAFACVQGVYLLCKKNKRNACVCNKHLISRRIISGLSMKSDFSTLLFIFRRTLKTTMIL